MVRHHRVHHVVGPPFRHVAGDAFRRSRMLAGGNLRAERCRVALAANVVIVLSRRFPAGHAMRIVARQAGQRFGSVRAIALQKALRLTKTVRGAADNFELIFMPRARRMVESQQEVAERFPRHKRKWPAVKAPDQTGKRAAGRLQMALHANIHLQIRTEPRRVHDTRADVRHLRARRPHCPDVIAARAMTSLAIDSFRQVAGK